MSHPTSGAEAGSPGSFSTEDFLSYSSRWDKKIATDLLAEMEILFGEKPATLPQMRNILAVKGHRGLTRRIEIDVEGRNGADAVRALANAMRNFALEHPGLSAATFRTPASDNPDWLQAGAELARVASLVLFGVGLNGTQAAPAFQILRNLVRGFVVSEMAASFSADPFEYRQNFESGIEVFIRGLPALGEDA